MINFRILLLLFILVCPLSLIFSQTYVDSITIVNKYGLYFSKNGKRLTPAKLVTAVKSNPEAYKIMKNAQESRDLGTIMGSIGSFVAGYAVGRSLGPRTLDKRTLIFGSALVLVSIPFSSGFSAKTLKAVKIYNAGLRDTQ